jgi:hypothetical protein
VAYRTLAPKGERQVTYRHRPHGWVSLSSPEPGYRSSAAVARGGDDRPGVGEEVADGKAGDARDGPELERSLPLEELGVTDSADRVADHRHDLAGQVPA